MLEEMGEASQDVLCGCGLKLSQGWYALVNHDVSKCSTP